jgi:hypothetical protein
MKPGSWISVRKVDFGTGANCFTLRAKGTATIELRFSRPGAPINTIEFSSSEMEEQTFEINAEKFQGVKNNFYIAVKEANNFYVDAWQFSNGQPSGIQEVNRNTNENGSSFYDLSGRRITKGQHHSGIIIERTADGNYRKVLPRN